MTISKHMKLYMLLIGLIWACNSPKSPKGDSTNILYFRDNTDSTIAPIDFKSLLEVYAPEKTIMGQHNFRVRTLTSTPFGEIENYLLQAGNSGAQTYSHRIKELKNHLNKIDKALSKQEKYSSNSETESFLFKPIMEELTLLSHNKATNNYVVLSCDLFENSPMFSIYNKTHEKLLFKNPEKVIEMFLEQIEIPNLSEVKVYILFKPRQGISSMRFEAMSNIYKSILIKAGAEVFISSSLTGGYVSDYTKQSNLESLNLSKTQNK